MVKTKNNYAIFWCTVTSNTQCMHVVHGCVYIELQSQESSTVHMPFLTIKTTGQWKISITIGVA